MVEVEGLNNRRGKICKAKETCAAAEGDASQNPDVRVFEDGANFFHGNSLSVRELRLNVEALNASLDFRRGEGRDLMRVIRQEKGRECPKASCKDALKTEDPLPSLHITMTVHVLNRCRQQTRKGAAQRRCREEQRDANLKLCRSIEAGEVQHDAGKQASLEETQEEPAGQETLIVVHQRLQRGNDAPCEAQPRQQYAGSNFLENEVRREFGSDVGDICHSNGCCMVRLAAQHAAKGCTTDLFGTGDRL